MDGYTQGFILIIYSRNIYIYIYIYIYNNKINVKVIINIM